MIFILISECDPAVFPIIYILGQQQSLVFKYLFIFYLFIYLRTLNSNVQLSYYIDYKYNGKS